MDITFINTLAGGVIVQISVALATVVGSVILVWGALIGLGFIKKYVSKWIGRRA